VTPRLFFAILFFFSGVAALIYEILWFRYFNLLFGNVVYATALVLGGFFAGLAIGNHYIGKYVDQRQSVLSFYAFLEIGIAAAAFPAPFLLDWLKSLPFSSSTTTGLFTLAILSVCTILPSAILMGGTLPALGREIATKTRDAVAFSGGRLYAINTFGAAIGAFLTGAFLPLYIGVWNTYILAIFINCTVAVLVFFWLQKSTSSTLISAVNSQGLQSQNKPNYYYSDNTYSLVFVLSFFSGLLTLALQVIWTRMFALVFHNSVFSFTTIVVTFLLGLAIGTFFAAKLINEVEWVQNNPWKLVTWTLSLAGLLISLSGPLFILLTGLEREPHGDVTAWPLLWAASTTTIVTALPIIVAGMILPLLWHLYAPKLLTGGEGSNVGRRLGRVVAINLLGSIIGALMSGFLLIPLVGLWQSLFFIALSYALLSIFVIFWTSREGFSEGNHFTFSHRVISWAVAIFLLTGAFLIPKSLGSLQLLRDGEKLAYHKEGKSASVAVVKQKNNHLKLKVNNTYGLGGSAGEIQERRMGHLPLLLHGDPKAVAFIGVATGITLSAVNLTNIGEKIQRVLAIELLPEVLEAANIFKKYTGDVLSDTRLEVRIGDGRHILSTSDEYFDVITLDLVTPWHANAGSLYTREFYSEVRNRLMPKGVFSQWLPLYQLGPEEFKIIANTFQKVFPHVQVWRGSSNPRYPMLALIGSNAKIDLEKNILGKTHDVTSKYTKDPYLVDLPSMFLLYAGDQDSLHGLVKNAPINSDNYPLIEYLAPISHISKQQFLGDTLIQFFDDLLAESKTRKSQYYDASLAGNLLLQANWEKRKKNYQKRTEFLDRARLLLPNSGYLHKLVIGL